MADDVDVANDRAQAELEAVLASRPRYELPAGVAGYCDHCGTKSKRLVGGACAPCRDKHKLP